MQKLILLVRGEASRPYSLFKDEIDQLGDHILKKHDPVALSYTITGSAPPLISVIPFKRSKIASISVYTDAKALSIDPGEMSGFSGMYLVEEALPVSYVKDWPDGQPTPGICLLTLFSKKPGIDHATFISRWHDGHTPLSLKLHPLWHYNRNVVVESLVRDGDPFDGVVEEHFNPASELLNPFKFFGGPFSIIQNMIAVYRDVNSFLDYSTIETYYCNEYHLKSAK